MPKPAAKKCEPCGKMRYRSYDLALHVLLTQSGRCQVALRIYECPHGKGYHLTRRTRWA